MLAIWIYSLVSVLVVSLISLLGVIILAFQKTRRERLLLFLVALSAGALFGEVLIHLLPELFATTLKPQVLSLTVLLGIVSFFILEKFLHWSHRHPIEDCEHAGHQTEKPVGIINSVGDGLHNLIDGLIIGVSYLTSFPLGVATTVAVILHEIPQEMGDFAILLQAGFSRRRAIMFNLLSASTALAGVTIALLVGPRVEIWQPLLLGFAAGGFLYIAGSDLVPELHRETGLKKTSWQLVAMISGILIMLGLTLFE